MVKKGLYFSLIAFLVLGVAVFTGCRRSGGHHGAEFAIDYVTEVLDLDEGQQEQLDQIKDELVEKGRQMHANRETMHNEIIVQLRSEEQHYEVTSPGVDPMLSTGQVWRRSGGRTCQTRRLFAEHARWKLTTEARRTRRSVPPGSH